MEVRTADPTIGCLRLRNWTPSHGRGSDCHDPLIQPLGRNPPAQEQANRVAAENTRQAAASDEPEFAESVETAPPQDAQLEGEAFKSDAESDTGAAEQTSDLDSAQAAEQQAEEAASDEAAEEMDEAAEEGGESASAAETASQAIGMLAAPMSEAATLGSNGVVFAPHPEERSGNAMNVPGGHTACPVRGSRPDRRNGGDDASTA